jgi:enterobactin synthetase component D
MLEPLPNPAILTTPYHYSARAESSPANPRQAEFIAGRFCAAKALHALDPSLTQDVGRHANGSPLWPKGIVGSITHTQGFVSAAVAKCETTLGLGIDSENMEKLDVMDAAKEVVMGDSEQQLLTTLSYSADEGRMLIFCAKESIYKCLYPLVQHSFDFHALTIDAIDSAIHTFRFHVVEPLHPDFPAGFQAQGRFEFSHGCVHTAVELSAIKKR